MPDDDKLDAMLRQAAQGYKAQGNPPADLMWKHIEGDVARAIKPELRVRRWPWVVTAAGIAAALVLGVAIGRRTAPRDARTDSAQSAAATGTPATLASGRDAQLRAVTLNHLAQAEVFLTEVRTDLKTGRRDPQRSDRSRELLARTRLLMSNDAGGAPAMDRLLLDLELVLAEIAALPDAAHPGANTMDAQLLAERLRTGTVLPRIRTILPSPSGGN